MPQDTAQTQSFHEMLTSLPAAKQDTKALQSFINNDQDHAILILGTDGHILICSDGVTQVYGMKRQELLDQHYGLFFTEDGRRAQRPQRALDDAKQTGRNELEGWHHTAHDSKLRINAIITPIRDDHGQLSGYGLIATDVTERYLAEQKLRQAYDQLEATAQDVMKLNAEMRDLNLRMTGREYLIRDLEHENKLLKLRLEIDCDYRQPEL